MSLLNPSNPSAAVDSLEQLFLKANNDLLSVQHKLEQKLDSNYTSNVKSSLLVSPVQLQYRLKKIQDELPSLEDECKKLFAAKQELIDKAKQILISNRAVLRRMQGRAGIPVTADFDDPVYTSFMNILKEWNGQLYLKKSESLYAPEDLNDKLFSSMIGGLKYGS